MQRTPKLKFRIKAELDDLEMTGGGKRICLLCSQTGWGEYWWSKHRIKPHVQCICGKVITASSLKRHQNKAGCLSA